MQVYYEVNVRIDGKPKEELIRYPGLLGVMRYLERELPLPIFRSLDDPHPADASLDDPDPDKLVKERRETFITEQIIALVESKQTVFAVVSPDHRERLIEIHRVSLPLETHVEA